MNDIDLTDLDLNDLTFSNEDMDAVMHEERLQAVSQEDYRQCCDSEAVTIITTHGTLMVEPIILPEGYKIILIAELGKCMNASVDHKKNLKYMYSKGHTIFENNDTIPILTPTGNKWVQSFQPINTDIVDSVSPTLYVGRNYQTQPIVDINGVEHYIPVNIPNIGLSFHGVGCNNWAGSGQKSCMISCVKKDEISICDKYYGQNITLLNLLRQEGKGTYIISTCLPLIHYSADDQQKVLNYFNSLKIIQNPVVRTRYQQNQLLEHLKLFDQFSVIGTTLYGKAKKNNNNNNKKSINLKRLQNKAKKIKLRITKIVRGKRVYKTIIELKNEINKKSKKKSKK